MNTDSRSFEKNSIIIFVIMMAANVCNYLFQVWSGKLLEVEEYAVLNAILSLLTIFLMFATIITLVASRYVSKYRALQEDSNIYWITRKLLIYSLLFAIALIVMVLTVSSPLAKLLKIDNSGLIVFAIVAVGINLVVSPITGALQGMQRFAQYSMVGFIAALFKLLLGVALLYLGFKVYGVIIAISIGYIASGIYGLYALRDYIKRGAGHFTRAALGRKDIIVYTRNTFLVQMGIVLLTNGDMLLVKMFFSEHESGIYASAMIIGKICMYVSTAIVAAVFPIAAEQATLKKDTRPLLKKSLLYGGGISVLCGLGLVLLGAPIINILFGARYAASVSLLLPIVAYIIPLTFLTVLANYAIALNKTKFIASSLIGGSLLIIVLALLFHQSIAQMLYIMATVLLAVFIVNLKVINQTAK